MLKAFEYRISPNKDQEMFLAKHFGCTRFVYNYFLAKRIEFYTQNKNNSNKKSLNYFDTSTSLTELKKSEDYKWLKEINSQSLQMSLRNLDTAYSNFFRTNKGFPKFKSKKTNRFSFQLPQNVKIDSEKSKLIIPKEKQGIKIVLHRALPENGVIKTVTIKKNPTGKYFAVVLIETPDEFPDKPDVKSNSVLGIDLGIKDFAITSDGEKFDNPKYLKNDLTRLKVLQKRHSRKKIGGQNRDKARIKVALQHEKIKNQRKDFLHKLSYKIVCENKTYNSIAIEDLAVKNMIKNHKLARAISDVSWSEFRQQLQYKCDWYGKNLLVIGRFTPSTKVCSTCGQIKEGLTLKDRTWICDCGTEHDRDINAAKNIANFGIIKYSGQGLPGEPVESSTIVGAMKQEALSFMAG